MHECLILVLYVYIKFYESSHRCHKLEFRLLVEYDVYFTNQSYTCILYFSVTYVFCSSSFQMHYIACWPFFNMCFKMMVFGILRCILNIGHKLVRCMLVLRIYFSCQYLYIFSQIGLPFTVTLITGHMNEFCM